MSTTIYMDRADKNKIGIFEIEDVRVIPVIFLPGIMGSNLKEKNGKKDSNSVWRYDSAATLAVWSAPWSGPIKRKEMLHPNKVDVDDRGEIFIPSGAIEQLSNVSSQYPKNPADKGAMEKYAAAIKQALENFEPESKLFGSRRERGWGEVAKASYGSFLDALQAALFRDKPKSKDPLPSEIYQKLLDEPLGLEFGPDSLDKEFLEVMKLYQFPVHAVGYNWLDSNSVSAERLSDKIDKIVSDYNKRRMKCHKVILVTHSMGGLVARYYSECLDKPGRDNIYGIVHGVMPSTGAAATYTRMKRGTENSESNLVGYITSHILGRNAAEMTAICSQSSGPLELLPSKDYGTDWLKIVDRDGSIQQLPGQDPYSVYLNRKDWWKLIDENLLDPLNTSLNQKKIEADWMIYEKIISRGVKQFHKNISEKYHPNSYSFYGKVKDGEISKAYLTQETVLWEGTLTSGDVREILREPEMNDGRLDLNEIGASRTVKDELSQQEQAWRWKGKHDVIYGWIGQRFTLRNACENGDGTVPIRAGKIIHSNIRERLAVETCHESAYKHPLSLFFTLRSIIKIAQLVQDDEKMAYAD